MYQTLFIDESGNLVLVNVSEDHSGHYQCQVNESGTIRNGSSYELTVQSPMGSLDHGERVFMRISCVIICMIFLSKPP